MPRIKIALLALIISSPAHAAETTKTAKNSPVKVAATDKISACGDRLQGFSFYELAEKENIVKKTAIFEMLDWSPHSSFEGMVAKKSETDGTSVEVEFRKTKNGKTVKKQEAKFKAWPENPEFKIADMDPKAVIGAEKMVGHFFVLRLKEGKKVLCEDAPRKIQLGD